MKKQVNFFAGVTLAAALGGVVLTACSTSDEPFGLATADGTTATVSFRVEGDWQNPTFTRAALSADGSAMTDLWVLDYCDGTLAQQLHQTQDDADFGQPRLALAMGRHRLYFVCSRGVGPVLDTDEGTLTWQNPRDTFWKDYELNVTSANSESRAVTLDRVSTKLHLAVLDEVPADVATVSVKADTWYYGLDYRTGDAAKVVSEDRTVSIGPSLVGTVGKLAVNIYGMSDADEWNTGLLITARAADGSTVSQVTIADAPFQRNRVTNYSGSLFANNGAFSISLGSEWDTAFDATW